MERKTFSLKELAQLTSATWVGNPDHQISGIEALESATSEDVSFLANLKYRQAMRESKAGIICIETSIPTEEGKNYLVSNDPSHTFQMIAQHLLTGTYGQSGFTGIHPTAVIHPTATIGQNVNIGPYAVIDQGAKIKDNTQIMAFVLIGPGVEIGSDCILHPHCTVRERCILGNRVILQPGVVIGSCGFGYLTDARGKHKKLEQLGSVVLEDDVEVGANTTIDRARFKITKISSGTKIDNLVQIGHNVCLGQDNIIVSQTGISGSVKTGRHVIIGGQGGIVGHLEITDNVMISARGGVSKSITEAGKYAGAPVMPLAEHNRQQVYSRKISQYVKQIESLEKRLAELEQKFSSHQSIEVDHEQCSTC